MSHSGTCLRILKAKRPYEGMKITGARIRSGERLLVKLIGANLAGAIMPDGAIHR